MLAGQAKRDYQHKYMADYMRDYRKRGSGIASESTTISERQPVKVFTGSLLKQDGSLQDTVKVFTKPVAPEPPVIKFKYPPQRDGEGDSQYNMRCVKIEREQV